MSNFEGYPGTGGFYEKSPVSTELQEETNVTQPKTLVIKAQNHHIALAAKYIGQYEDRINDDRGRFSDILDRQVFEDRAYKQAMMHAAYAQAEAATRQAEATESLLEFMADLIGKTDLVNALLQWSYQQRAG